MQVLHAQKILRTAEAQPANSAGSQTLPGCEGPGWGRMGHAAACDAQHLHCSRHCRLYGTVIGDPGPVALYTLPVHSYCQPSFQAAASAAKCLWASDPSLLQLNAASCALQMPWACWLPAGMVQQIVMLQSALQCSGCACQVMLPSLIWCLPCCGVFTDLQASRMHTTAAERAYTGGGCMSTGMADWTGSPWQLHRRTAEAYSLPLPPELLKSACVYSSRPPPRHHQG